MDVVARKFKCIGGEVEIKDETLQKIGGIFTADTPITNDPEFLIPFSTFRVKKYIDALENERLFDVGAYDMFNFFASEKYINMVLYVDLSDFLKSAADYLEDFNDYRIFMTEHAISIFENHFAMLINNHRSDVLLNLFNTDRKRAISIFDNMNYFESYSHRLTVALDWYLVYSNKSCDGNIKYAEYILECMKDNDQWNAIYSKYRLILNEIFAKLISIDKRIFNLIIGIELVESDYKIDRYVKGKITMKTIGINSISLITFDKKLVEVIYEKISRHCEKLNA